jgi:hypothetical protein
MIEGSCHCGAVRYETDLAHARDWLTRCNCSLCRRIGALWAHTQRQHVKLTYAPDAVIKYMWGDKSLATVSCKTCGCTTHWDGLTDDPEGRMAVNTNMADPRSIAGIRIRTFDGADSWEFLD